MFGKPQRGVSERPKQKTTSMPKWLWGLLGILLLIFCLVMLLLWRPWQPVNAQNQANSVMSEDNLPEQEFRFYDLLPKQQVTPIPQQAQTATEMVAETPTTVVDTSDAPASSGQTNTGTAQIESSEINQRYILQIRSYLNPDQADSRRAEVIMSGLSADVITYQDNGQIWYRVISGPYDSEQAAFLAQQTLQNSGIDSIVVKSNQN